MALSIQDNLLKKMGAHWLLRDERDVPPIRLDVHLRNVLTVDLLKAEVRFRA